MTTTVVTKPSRRVPPPCWTQDEAQSLILAYRDRWSALRRANLKAADWDHVAKATAAASSSASSPPKTALQCRHKMEKLRKRYRAEKQRASNHPGRFISSWALFPLMDEMESGPNPKPENQGEYGGGFSFKARNLVTVDSPNVDFDEIGGSEFGVESQLYQNYRFNYKNSGFYSEDNEYVNRGGVPLKTRSNGKSDVNVEHSFKQHRDYGVDIRSDRGFVPDGSWKRNVHCQEFDGYASLSGAKFGKKRCVVGMGMERDVEPVADLASSIRMFGEGFERVERMKMELTWEIEKRWMETELKRTEAMNVLQEQFVAALFEKKKKKKVRVESSHA